MKITTIPFVEHLGIQQEQNHLVLEPSRILENHIGTIHASVQFTLAESQSGLFLQTEFPDIGEVIALLRSSTVKYKLPAKSKLIAKASMTQESKEKFMAQFTKKGRAAITVQVEIQDREQCVTMMGEFIWFIQRGS